MTERVEQQVITLSTEILGMAPYVVLEVEPDGEDDEGPGYKLSIRAGGGIRSQETIMAFMLQAVSEMAGVEIGEFLVIIDTYRRASGLKPLTEVAFRD